MISPHGFGRSGLGWRHPFACLQRGIHGVPRRPTDAVGEHLRCEAARFVQAARMDRDQLRHRGKAQEDRRSADRAEGVDLHVAAVARDLPVRRLAGDLDLGPRGKGQVGAVPGAASLLAVAALAVVLEDGRVLGGVADRAARASAGVGLSHERLPVEAAFGLAKTSMPCPVSRRDFRLERTIGQPCWMPLAIPLPASSSSWVTVSRTISSYAATSKLTRL